MKRAGTLPENDLLLKKKKNEHELNFVLAAHRGPHLDSMSW